MFSKIKKENRIIKEEAKGNSLKMKGNNSGVWLLQKEEQI